MQQIITTLTASQSGSWRQLRSVTDSRTPDIPVASRFLCSKQTYSNSNSCLLYLWLKQTVCWLKNVASIAITVTGKQQLFSGVW